MTRTITWNNEKWFKGNFTLLLALIVSGIIGWQVRNNSYRAFSDFITIFMSILLEAFPFVILGTLISSSINLFVTPNLLAKILPKSKITGLLIASLAGFAFPICECANVPVTKRLLAKGLPAPIAATFLLSVAIVNPVVLLSTWIAFGGSWKAVLARGGLGMAIAIAAGLLISLIKSLEHPLKENTLNHNDETKSSSLNCTCMHNQPHKGNDDRRYTNSGNHSYQAAQPSAHRNILNQYQPKTSKQKRTIVVLAGEILRHTSSELFDVGRFLITGAAVASMMQVVLPRASLISIGGQYVASIAVMMFLGYVLSLCSEADAFIAATFAGYFTPGAIVAFMIYGPMMDIKNTLMMINGFKTRFVITIMIITTALCMLAGLLINLSGILRTW